MAKKKVDKIKIEVLNGVRFPTPLEIPIYYDGYFFCYVPVEVEGFVKKESETTRYEKKPEGGGKHVVKIITATSPDSIKTIIWEALSERYNNAVVQKKIIAFRFKFNSNKHYFNHRDNISFADTPCLSLWYRIYYHVTLPNGVEKIFSDPYEGYGNICSNKFDTYVSEYKEKWIDWTEEREEFFKGVTDSMEGMIEKIFNFFSKDSAEIALLVDNKAGLLTN